MSPQSDAELETFETQIDLHNEGVGLKERLEHYEGHLKNGSQDDRRAIARGVSALLAASVEHSKKLAELATRPEVREMISSHATTCAMARPAQVPPQEESISFFGGKVSAKGRKSIWATLIIVAILALLLFYALPFANDLLATWKGTAAKAEQAVQKAEQAAEVAVVSQDKAQQDREVMIAMMRQLMQEVRAEEVRR
jgi:hypothetical protein